MTEEREKIVIEPADGTPEAKMVAEYVSERLAGNNIVIGPAELYTQPVESPIFEAIDRASEDRTPVYEFPVFEMPKLGDSWAKMVKGIADRAQGLAKTMQAATDAFTVFADLVTPDMGDQTHAEWKLEMLEQIYGPLTYYRGQVALLGTGKRRHRATRGQRTELGLSRAEHARRRRLHSERLRRDRRRRRDGRAPILRSSTFETLIPNAQINATKAGPEYLGMEIVAHPWVPEDQAWIIDPSILDGYRFTEPKTFMQDPGRSRYADQVALYASTWARYGSPTGRTHRATNYLVQADAERRQSLGGWNGPVVIAIDETADWAPEHGVDVDRWLDDGGAE